MKGSHASPTVSLPTPVTPLIEVAPTRQVPLRPRTEIPRIGELLVRSGWLSDRQLQYLLELQEHRARPLGALAEDVYLIPAHIIAKAWAQQHAQVARIDLDDHAVDPAALALIDRRQAWQFQMLPLSRNAQGVLLIATTAPHLLKVLAFAHHHLGSSLALLVADRDQLRQSLDHHYPWPAMDQASTPTVQP